MVARSKLQGFTSSWEKTVAWAQTQGIPKSAYLPVYQMDSQRFLGNQSPMSTAERTRAILAAYNPNDVSAVPVQHGGIGGLWDSTVNDLKNIFTGLAPNHLVTNIYDTIHNAVVHPSTWLKPLEEIAQGHFRTGFEEAAGLEGPGSILSWLPGVYDIGEAAQGGVGEVLAHPVSSFIDAAPFAPVGRILTAGADASRVAQMAEKVGMTPEKFRKASGPGMAKAFVLSRKVGDVPFVGKRARSLVDARGNPITISDALNTWITAHTGMGKTLSALMKGMLLTNEHGTAQEMSLFRPAEMAMGKLKPEEQALVEALVTKRDKRAQGKTQSQIERDQSIPAAVRTAYSKMESVRVWVSDHALAAGDDISVARPDGTIGIYHSAGEPSAVVVAGQRGQAALNALIGAMEPAHALTLQIKALDDQAAALYEPFSRSIDTARARAAALDGKERFHSTDVTEPGRILGRAEKVTLDLRKQAEAIFGTEAVEGAAHGIAGSYEKERGITGLALMALHEGDWGTLAKMSEIGLRRLSRSGPGSIDAALDPSFARVRQLLETLHAYARKRIEMDRTFLSRFMSKTDEGYRQWWDRKTNTLHGVSSEAIETIRPHLREYLSAQRAFSRAVRDNPTADWVDVVKEKFIEKLLDEEKRFHRLDEFSTVLRKQGVGAAKIAELRRDPVKLAQIMLVHFQALSANFAGSQILSAEDVERLWKSGVDEANKLRQSGHEVVWVPHVSSLDVRDSVGRYGVHLSAAGKVRLSSRAFRKNLAFTATRHDVMASLHQAAKEALQIDATIEYAQHFLSPMMVSGTQALTTVEKTSGLFDVLSGYDTSVRDAGDVLDTIMRDHFNMVRFDPNSHFGFTLPRWEGDSWYLPAGVVKSLDKMLVKGQFPLDGVVNRATKLFRTSILGLSPRYTAHVVFGGTFLLALRSSPQVLRAIPEAMRIMRDQGEVPRGMFDGATQRGVDPIVYRTFAENTRNRASQVFHRAAASQGVRWLSEEQIEKVQGIDLAKANPIHWLRAVAEVNYKVTNWASSFQRSVAYVDHLQGSRKEFTDPVTGAVDQVSKERAEREAMQHSLKVMGDLKAMTPLERAVLTNIFPFYGWTKHILEFVLTFPADHPWRAQFVSTLAEQNSADVASGLPTRIQFLLFLGSPDVQGNVNAVDVRALDPLRDVANYASLAGWVSSLNPVITAPLTMAFGPEAVFGGVPLYPKVTYDQFYGIESAGSQGSPLNAVEQIVPQVSALDAALGLSGQYRNLAATNPNAFAKALFGALNIPFAQVQHLNLKQIAAKDELDRYRVASAAAQAAWKSGDFSAIDKLPTVPDPVNVDYEVTPAYLESLYKQLAAQYPGLPPSETAIPPPAPPI